MVHWLEVKKNRVKPSFQETIQELLKRKRLDSLDESAANEEKKRARKEKRERVRLEKIEKQKESEAHLTSYINKDQFDILFEATLEINQKIYQHSEIVDELERDLLKINRKRKQIKDNSKPLDSEQDSNY